MDIYDKSYRELKRLIRLGLDEEAEIKKDLLIFEDALDKRQYYIIRAKNRDLTKSIELTDKEFMSMLLKVMDETNLNTRDKVDDFLQINYGESLEQTLERF